MGMLSSPAAFGAQSREEMFKEGRSWRYRSARNSWLSIQHSIQQFAHPEFRCDSFSVHLAVGCAWVILGIHAARSLMDPLSDLEERKTLILLGVGRCVVAD